LILPRALGCRQRKPSRSVLTRNHTCRLDIRSCFNWDTGKSFQEMKDMKGEWRSVGD